MTCTKRYKGKSHKHYQQIIVFILVAICIAACTSISKPTSLPTELAPTSMVKVSTPTNAPPTVVLSTTATNPLSTSVPSTDEFETDAGLDNSIVLETNRMNIEIGDHLLTATFVENSSVDALKKALSEGPITVKMRDYGSMEKVGPLGMDLPRNDQQITTEPGDIILFQGSELVIYYAPNSWNFTRLGKIDNVTKEELREILGDGNVTITLSLHQE